MKKKTISFFSICMLLYLFVYTPEVRASDTFYDSREETELIDIDLNGEKHAEVTYEEADGTKATITFSRVDPYTDLQNNITPFALTKGRGYRYTYNGGTNRYHFVVRISTNDYTISQLDDLQYNWKDGIVRSTSLKRLSSTTGRAQLIIDTPWDGTKTETANVQLIKTGRGSSWHILVRRNGNSSGVRLRDSSVW